MVLGYADFERFVIKNKTNHEFLYSINTQINYDLEFENTLIMEQENKIFNKNKEFLGQNYFKTNKPVFVNCFSKLSLFGRNYRLNKVVCKNKVALITGISGQDGSYLTELLLNKGYMVL